jgi:hypothetical protein
VQDRPVSGLGIDRLGFAALACMASLIVLAATQAMASERVRYSTGKFVVNCTPDSTPQVCDPPKRLKVRVRHGKIKIKRLRYVAATEHCSAGRVRVSLDGDAIGHTDYVNAGEQAIVDDLRVTLDRGRHRFAFRIQGKTGGCNVGSVASWGGKIILKGTRLSG